MCFLQSLRVLRVLLLVPLSAWTVFVGISRVTDFWHFPSDVAGGVVLALSCIVPAFAFRSDDYVYEKRELDKLPTADDSPPKEKEQWEEVYLSSELELVSQCAISICFFYC